MSGGCTLYVGCVDVRMTAEHMVTLAVTLGATPGVAVHSSHLEQHSESLQLAMHSQKQSVPHLKLEERRERRIRILSEVNQCNI